MDYKELFSIILDKDEKILKTYRPNKMRAWGVAITTVVLLAIFFVPILMGAFQEGNGVLVGIYMIVFLVCLILLMSISILLWLNKTVYAVTNKRIIIRTGFIGVDYKSLDFTYLGALTVNVGWLDKLLHLKTGSIAFGSMSSPMTTNTTAKFNFAYIKNPYEEYREIKLIIDEHKSK